MGGLVGLEGDCAPQFVDHLSLGPNIGIIAAMYDMRHCLCVIRVLINSQTDWHIDCQLEDKQVGGHWFDLNATCFD